MMGKGLGSNDEMENRAYVRNLHEMMDVENFFRNPRLAELRMDGVQCMGLVVQRGDVDVA